MVPESKDEEEFLVQGPFMSPVEDETELDETEKQVSDVEKSGKLLAVKGTKPKKTQKCNSES